MNYMKQLAMRIIEDYKTREWELHGVKHVGLPIDEKDFERLARACDLEDNEENYLTTIEILDRCITPRILAKRRLDVVKDLLSITFQKVKIHKDICKVIDNCKFSIKKGDLCYVDDLSIIESLKIKYL